SPSLMSNDNIQFDNVLLQNNTASQEETLRERHNRLQRERRRCVREQETSNQIAQRQASERHSHAHQRATEAPEQLLKCKQYDRQQHKLRRANEIPEQTLKRQQDDRQRQRGRKVQLQYKAARVVPFISNGLQCHDLGHMNISCTYCLALHWIKEKLSSSTIWTPQFSTCCASGKVNLPLLQTPPPPLIDLLTGDTSEARSFRKDIRRYNSALAFVSLGAKIDENVTCHHGLAEGTLKALQQMLHTVNPYAQVFRQASMMLQIDDKQELRMVISPTTIAGRDPHCYNTPTAAEVAIIMVGDGEGEPGHRDIVVHTNAEGQLQRISEIHKSYMPLHYVLLFPRGEDELEENDNLTDLNEEADLDNETVHSRKCVSMMQFYAHRLQQNRLNWLKHNQKNICSELYNGIQDALTAADEAPQPGRRIGCHIVLLSSFTEGWFKANEELADAGTTELTYGEFPRRFVWNKCLKKWTPRKKGNTLGRIYFVHPAAGERFFLQVLLTVVHGAKSFENLRTVNETTYETFKDACNALGLLQDNNEWDECLGEASLIKTGYQLCHLFATILVNCEPLDPEHL
ncbi:4231_t:CDS:2, partial [Acaulospora morrowiae]